MQISDFRRSGKSASRLIGFPANRLSAAKRTSEEVAAHANAAEGPLHVRCRNEEEEEEKEEQEMEEEEELN